MSKHTPGPWTLGEPIKADHPTLHTVYRLIFGKGRKLASITAYGKKKDGTSGGRDLKWGGKSRTVPETELHANGRLIAAAPELLDALKAIEAFLFRCEGNGGSTQGQNTTLAEVISFARSTIAKAEGKN